MKIGLAVAPQEALPSAFVVFRDRLDVCVEKACGLGYDGIELALARASDVDVSSMLAILAGSGMELAAVSTGRVFAEQHVWLTNPDEANRRQAVAILKELIDVAAALGTSRVNIGRVRGFVNAGDPTEAAEARFIEAITECADYALPAGIDILLEPVNRYEINYINNVFPEGIALINQLNCSNVKLMPDVFHMNIEDASIADSLMAAGSKVGYVHLADSNRWAPGQGHTDFPAIITALRSIGYDDYVTVEILPYPSPDEAAEQAVTYLRTLIPRVVA
jgi:sugar phosphate isomerase/epimerase